MAIKDTILSSPVNIQGLIDSGRSKADLTDILFSNFMNYAKAHWTYNASGCESGVSLLDGSKTLCNCRGIRHALDLMFIEIGFAPSDVVEEPIAYTFWTDPQFHCFDATVTGNIANADAPSAFGNGCVFSNHYFTKCNGKYYDPCMDTTYSNNTAIIGHLMHNLGGFYHSQNLDQLIINILSPVSGFSSKWLIISTPEQLQTHITDRRTLLAISTCRVGSLKIGKLVKKARELSKRMYKAENNLDTWESRHASMGINAKY